MRGNSISAQSLDVQDLLVKTSRTFALAIPLLEEPVRGQVGLAYLLYRIADTFEDGVLWSPVRRGEALRDLDGLLAHPAPEKARRLRDQWVADPPIDHAGYQELLGRTPDVLEALEQFDPGSREILRRHLRDSAQRMAGFVARSDADGSLVLKNLADLRDYCYAVAGVVGEMLTHLFLHHLPMLEAHANELHARSRWFGEALQLVNILKDSRTDAGEGRRYLPPGVEREQVLELAQEDRVLAQEYIRILEEAGAPSNVIAYHALIARLAGDTLIALRDQGPGAKLTRPEVAAILIDVQRRAKAKMPSFGE